MKYASTLLYDEPNDHELACQFLTNFFLAVMNPVTLESKYHIIRNWRRDFPPEFIAKHKLDKTRDHFYHKFDVVLFHFLEQPDLKNSPIAFFEIGQVCGTVVTLPDGNRIKVYKSKHGKKNQIINDGVIQDYVDTYYPNIPLYRPEKSDCLNYQYLYETYKGYMK